MSIEGCLKNAKERFEKGNVESERVSFICIRKNELKAGGIDDTLSMKQANEEWNQSLRINPQKIEIDGFISLFRQKIDQLLNQKIIVPSKKEEAFCPGDWTFLFNCVVYDLIKEYNKMNGTNLSLCAEPEANKSPTGRGGYSDILICSEDGEKEHIIIEHENFPHGTLAKNVKKLASSKAKHKLLITYYYDDYPKKKIMRELKEYTAKYFKEPETLHLLISHSETDCGEDYEYQQIKGQPLQNEMHPML